MLVRLLEVAKIGYCRRCRERYAFEDLLDAKNRRSEA